ncbi:MAG: Hsp20/alpha crystallin family protein [Nitrososphaeraceae archaeon]
MNDWDIYIEEWISSSSMVFVEYEFDLIKQEPSIGFDKTTEDFDRIFNDELNDLEFSESYMGVSSDNVKEEVDIMMYASYPSNIKLNKNTQKRKTKRNAKPASVKRRKHLNSYSYNLTDGDNITGSTVPLPIIENEEREYLEDVIVTDKSIKVVSQMPINNRKEDIKVVAYSNNSVTISNLDYEGNNCKSTLVIPHNIDIDTARSTYRNGILEITFNRS